MPTRQTHAPVREVTSSTARCSTRVTPGIFRLRAVLKASWSGTSRASPERTRQPRDRDDFVFFPVQHTHHKLFCCHVLYRTRHPAPGPVVLQRSAVQNQFCCYFAMAAHARLRQVGSFGRNLTSLQLPAVLLPTKLWLIFTGPVPQNLVS